MVATEIDKVDEIVERYTGEEGVLIQVLLDVQREYNWLPKEAIARISERMGIPITQVYRVASFYKAMSLTPVGRHVVSVCLGTACHVRGAPKVLDKVEEVLGLGPGETSEDMKFTLDTVNCLGCCALGPVMVVDGEYYGKLPVSKVSEILDNYE
ncbi:MAG: NADH-quinone oxidoreductase subunit NuoE [Chloroflexota bacterium]|nr:NADH-quinone oxidoreductase subunit NuoE [Chloroflexota bacterium]